MIPKDGTAIEHSMIPDHAKDIRTDSTAACNFFAWPDDYIDSIWFGPFGYSILASYYITDYLPTGGGSNI